MSLTLPFTTGASGLGAVQVLTAGAPSLDFVLVPGGTCNSSTVSGPGCGSGSTCTSLTGPATPCSVEVTFLPTALGLRNGAVVLYDTDLNPILTVPLYGWGDAPVAALSPNPGSVISTGGVTLSFPFQLAPDGAGNLYVADDGGNVIRIPAGGGPATVVALPTGGEVDAVAIDGAGNLFVSDHLNNRILVATPAGVVSILSITGLSPVLGHPVALAFDGAGNLYSADYTNGRIIRVSTLVVAGSTSSGLGTVIGTGAFTLAGPSLTGMTVDAQGNIYAAARTDNSSSVIKVTTAGVASELSFPGITPALSNPQGVAVDAMGNVYVLDGDSPSGRIVRLTTAGVASVLGISVLPAPLSLGSSGYGVTLDPFGNLYIPDASNNRIVFVNISAASLVFPSTNVGSTSTAQTATVANLGDLPLVFATNPTYTVNFSEDTGDENLCALGTSLGAGTLCDVSVEFTPQSAGSLSASIVVTNNSLNLTATTQNIAVSGTGISVADTTAVAVSANPTTVVLGQSITVTAIVTDTTTGHTATIPTGGVTFMDTLGSTTVSLNGGSAVTLNGSRTAILAGVTLVGAGTHTITANYVGVTGSFLPSSSTTTISVAAGPITPTINWTAPGAITYGTTLGGILDASAVSGSTPVAGTFAYTATLTGGNAVAVTGATVLGVGSYMLTATFTPADPTTYVSASATVALTVNAPPPITTTTTLTVSPNPLPDGQPATLTATVTPAPTGSPAGTIGFYSGTTLLGTGTLNASGTATLTTSGLVVGTDVITAAYAGNAGYAASTSSAVSEAVTTFYTIAGPAVPIAVVPGGAVTIDITVPPLGGPFDNVVTLSASGLPPGATATFNPPTVTPGGAGAPTVLTIQLATLTASIPGPGIPTNRTALLILPFSLGFVLLGVVLGRKRIPSHIPRTLMLAVALAVLGIATSLVTGCGGGFANTPSTPAANYTVTVTGTSGSFQASTTVTLAVQ